MPPAPLQFDYPKDLPVSQERERICAALRDHQVIIVCGDTGSGKTTQLPKMIAEVLGEQVRGKISVTQPRRLAATRMAARVAEECRTPLGQGVGVRVRFDDRTSKHTRIQFMTDGLLLAQLPRDPLWKEYAALMIDEAHERSLNIDFLLGCIQTLLPRRPDLKIILSSATLDAERFSSFFAGAPILEVQGRLFPIQDEYRPEGDRDRPLPDRVQDALQHLDHLQPGLDTLVFLPGEREIRETAQKLKGGWKSDADILPLYARLAGRDQDKSFSPSGRRRVILATNVAETSITIPGIRAVIDTGQVRLQRFHPQTGIQRLVTESVSQASAKQRRGRCGRTGPGICVRLYSEEELEQAPAYVDPEIRRSSLAEVILRMAVLGLPHLNEFPLLDPPKGAAINQGVRTLVDIGAMTPDREVTPRGRVLATFPLDPRLARMLEEGHEEKVLPAVLIVVAFLSIQDPRERPSEKAEAADTAHKKFRNAESDFLGILDLWNATATHPSQSKRNRFCKDHFLHPGRVREWHNLVEDLRDTCKDHQWTVPSSIGEVELLDTEGLHRSVLAGVPRCIGQQQDNRMFRSPGGREFQVFPGSGLSKKPPKWVMAFALMETSRLWAREAAALKPEWVEHVASHLCKAHYERPVWNAKRGFVEAEERIQFGQLTLRQGSRVHYGRVDPQEARRIFLEDGVVPANLPIAKELLAPYVAFRDTLGLWERKLRVPGAYTGTSFLLDHFDNVIPREIFTAKAFARWCPNHDWIPNVRTLTPGEFRTSEDHPDTLEVNGVSLKIDYAMCPDDPEQDGITFEVREEDLDRVPPEVLEWTIPAWTLEKIEGLIRSLDKKLRVQCAPYGKTAEAALAWMEEEGFVYTHSLTGALAAFLAAKLNCILAAPDLDPGKLPPHLIARLRIVDEHGHARFEGGEVPSTGQLKPTKKSASKKGQKRRPEKVFTQWPEEAIPELQESDRGVRFPALSLLKGGVTLRAYATREEAANEHARAAAWLFMQTYADVMRFLQKQFPLSTHLQLSLSLERSVGDSALEDLQQGVLIRALQQADPFPRTQEVFTTACEAVRSDLFDLAEATCIRVEGILREREEIREALEGCPEGLMKSDLQLQDHLLWRAGWVMDPVCLDRYPSYLKGMSLRMERGKRDAGKDAVKAKDLEPALTAFAEHSDRLTPRQTEEALLRLEELRLAVFTPEIKPAGKTSHQRFVKWLESL